MIVHQCLGVTRYSFYAIRSLGQMQVQLQLVTATVKLFLKKPTERPQQMIQLVLTYATQETDNPDLRDRAYVYWCVASASSLHLWRHVVLHDTLHKSRPLCTRFQVADSSCLLPMPYMQLIVPHTYIAWYASRFQAVAQGSMAIR